MSCVKHTKLPRLLLKEEAKTFTVGRIREVTQILWEIHSTSYFYLPIFPPNNCCQMSQRLLWYHHRRRMHFGSGHVTQGRTYFVGSVLFTIDNFLLWQYGSNFQCERRLWICKLLLLLLLLILILLFSAFVAVGKGVE